MFEINAANLYMFLGLIWCKLQILPIYYICIFTIIITTAVTGCIVWGIISCLVYARTKALLNELYNQHKSGICSKEADTPPLAKIMI